jgi:hypothetical protein
VSASSSRSTKRSLTTSVSAELKHLTLSSVRLYTTFSPFSNLVSLSLHCKIKRLQLTSSTFTPTTLPHLRALYTTALIALGTVYQLLDFPLLHPQLELLQLHQGNHASFTAGTPSSPSRALLSFRLNAASKLNHHPCNLFHHFQLDAEESLDGTNTRTSKIRTIASHLSDDLAGFVLTHPTIETLSLPAQLLPKPKAVLPPLLEAARDVLLQACEVKGVKVIWRKEARTLSDDLEVSREVWEYVNERARRAQVGAGK